MPHRKKPIKQRPKVEDESLGNPREYHGTHREGDEALPGSGGSEGGLNKQSEGGGSRQNRGNRERQNERSIIDGHEAR